MLRRGFGKVLFALFCGFLAITTIILGLFFLPAFFGWQLGLMEGMWSGIVNLLPYNISDNWVFAELQAHGRYLIMVTFYTSLWYLLLT